MARTGFLSGCFFLTSAVGLWLLLPSLPASVDAFTAAAFVCAAVLLSLFDVWLPQGDAAGVDGVIVLCAALLLSPFVAIAAAVIGRVIAWLLRRPRQSVSRLVEVCVRRSFVTVCCSALFTILGGWKIAVGGHGGQLALYPRLAAVSALFFVLDVVVSQLDARMRLSSPLLSLLIGNIRLQGWVGGASISAAILMLLIYGSMQVWGLAIVVCLLLVMRQSFSLLMEVRGAYSSTVEALARAIEAQNPTRRGHGERVAVLAREAGRALHFHGKDLESLTYAALFHDVAALRQDHVESGPEVLGSAAVLESVELFRGAVPILRLIDTLGSVASSQSEERLVSAYIIARMSEFDDACYSSQARQGPLVSNALAGRLYSSTLRSADRVVSRLQNRVQSGRFDLSAAHLGDAA